jgi:hypothetical protein
MTNHERIKSMTAEELARALAEYNTTFNHLKCPDGATFYDDYGNAWEATIAHTVEWLNRESD